jgi:hypothetical protein
MIGATTYAMDRIIPDVERIWTPELVRKDGAGTVCFELGELTTWPGISRTSRKLRILNKIRPPAEISLGNQIFFDVRADDFFNWSHQVNFYLSLALAARKWLGEPLVIVLPKRMPPVVSELYGLFDFKTIETDGPVRGRRCTWTVTNWEVVNSGRKLLVPDEYELPSFDTPKKAFIARRRYRAISNQAEVALSIPEYTTVYAEDLTAAEQFALFRNATHIIAVHGASLAPMQYRPRSSLPLRLIEISPAGMVTRWFSTMCHQVGGRYIQVRGRLKPEYVDGLYGRKPFVEYTNDSFEVDPRSLQVALDMIEEDCTGWDPKGSNQS